MRIDWELLDRYLAGECTPAEQLAIAGWLQDTPAAAELLAALRRAGDAAESVWQEWNVDQAWEASRHRLTGAAPSRAATVGPRGHARRPVHRWDSPSGWTAGIAAVAGLAAAIVLAVVWPGVRHRSVSDRTREFTTVAGSRSAVTLPDGTHLVLGPASRLRVPADFGVRDRTVDLDGEGYFTVVHNVAHPFAVRTARATVRDVGTTFSVRDYTDDHEERVAVSEGEVAIGAVAVRARDVATVDSIGQVRVQASGDIALELVWTQGGLAFQRTPLVDVVRDVARTFGLRITIADTALGNQLITAAFGSQSADEVLDEVTRLVGAEYTRDGTRVAIRRRAGGADWRRAPSSGPLQTARTTDVQE